MNYAVEQWNYLYTGNYGSPDFSVATAGNKGHDKIPVKSARLSRDGRSALLEIPGLQPSMQMRIRMTLTSAEGATVNQEIYNTIHKLGKAPVSFIQ